MVMATSTNGCMDKQETEVYMAEKEAKKQETEAFSFSPEERHEFVKIDRDAEDKKVVLFQKTGDINLFNEIYNARIPTLQIWARRNGYLMDSSEDMFGELNVFFSKAVEKYNRNKGSFNTCLYTFLINCVRNLRSGKQAKKRKPEGADPDSITNYTLSLDYTYNDKNGSKNTLQDVLSEKMSHAEDAPSKIHLDEMVSILGGGDNNTEKFLKKLSEGSSLTSLIKESKTKKGKVKISRKEVKRLDNKRKCNRIVTNIIKDKGAVSGRFDLIDYSVKKPNQLDYIIEMKKTKASDHILRNVRKWRKDKDYISMKFSA